MGAGSKGGTGSREGAWSKEGGGSREGVREHSELTFNLIHFHFQ